MPFNVNFVSGLDSKASPQSYRRHQHYARQQRQRYGAQFKRFLNVQATRLSTTATAMFNFLDANSAYKETKVASTASLTADPYPAKSK